MASYMFWILQAQRYDACVDYASPITAWKPRMFEILKECNGDKLKATTQWRQEKNASSTN